MDFWWEHSPEEVQLRRAFRSVTSNVPRTAYRESGLTRDELKYEFEIGYVADNVTSEARERARDTFFQMIEELGYYDASDFDWDAWREWYEETH